MENSGPEDETMPKLEVIVDSLSFGFLGDTGIRGFGMGQRTYVFYFLSFQSPKNLNLVDAIISEKY